MVRRGSTVRVRQRASKLPAKAGFLLPKLIQRSTSFVRRGAITANAAGCRGTGVNPGERKAPAPTEEAQWILGTVLGDTAGARADVRWFSLDRTRYRRER